jgi:uncharacterized protein (TIGR03435 family)
MSVCCPGGARWSGVGAAIVGYPMAEIARMLGPMVNRVAVDETRLQGNWDLELDGHSSVIANAHQEASPTSRKRLRGR